MRVNHEDAMRQIQPERIKGTLTEAAKLAYDLSRDTGRVYCVVHFGNDYAAISEGRYIRSSSWKQEDHIVTVSMDDTLVAVKGKVKVHQEIVGRDAKERRLAQGPDISI